MASNNQFEVYLKEALQITNARWAVLVEFVDHAWDLQATVKLSKLRRDDLVKFINSSRGTAWLSGGLAGGHSRSRKTSIKDNFDCARVYLFPVKDMQSLILVGIDTMMANEQRVWHLLASMMGSVINQLMILSPANLIPEVQAGISYDLPQGLEKMLGAVVRYIPCQAAWLAIHSGDVLEIKAQSNFPAKLQEKIAIDSSEVLRRINLTRHSQTIKRDDPKWNSLPFHNQLKKAEVWVGIPLAIGKRLIGILAIWRDTDFSSDEWEQLLQIVAYITPSVELMVTFDEISSHLRRLAMLNDFALTISSAKNLEQIVRRVFALLARSFGTELVTLTLLSTDRKDLREYRNLSGKVDSHIFSLERYPSISLLESGKILRIDKISEHGYHPFYAEAQSAIVVPLRYRGQVIGILGIENTAPGSYGLYDENLLMVIASHLAGLVEYGRLREEAEARARNLGLIHEVVQQVIGLTDAHAVAEITADLLVQYFSFELAIVLLADEDQKLTIAGVNSNDSRIVDYAFEALKQPVELGKGISGRVYQTGKSLLVNDVTRDPYYRPIQGWETGSEMCVGLHNGGGVLGLIDVESSQKNAFTRNDLLALESLAGILAGVIGSADQYQRLQSVNRQLRTTQDELQSRIEAQREVENRLIQAAKLAAVGEMAAGIAHELNNPLTTVTGFAELILDELPPDASQRKDLELVLREARRARSVVRRLLDFARQTESVRVRADLNEVVEDVAILMNHLFHTNGVQFSMTLAEEPPWVFIDRNQMKQVVLNLFHNSLHAMPQGGKLSVRTREARRDGRRWLTMSIEDSGMGIAPEIMGRIFEPFFTTKADDGGTGLGLAVTYGIITEHNGFIDVQSEPDKGARFTVWLPVEE
jgi:signal transduction histidine kinase/uncharacterized protein YigA (DUF484 family)